MMDELRGFWMRLLGMRPMTPEQWRRWAIEQAVASGANHNQVHWMAHDILRFVFPPEHTPTEAEIQMEQVVREAA